MESWRQKSSFEVLSILVIAKWKVYKQDFMKGLLKAGIGFVDTVIWFRSFLVSLQVFQPKNLENGVLSISRRLKYVRRK